MITYHMLWSELALQACVSLNASREVYSVGDAMSISLANIGLDILELSIHVNKQYAYLIGYCQYFSRTVNYEIS